MTVSSQMVIDSKNVEFWQELCGSQLAKQLGVTDSSVESLSKFDDFYLDFYPYLSKYLHLNELQDKKILEVGLGYGTVSQLLALSGGHYHGLDISPNAVGMVKHRLLQHNLQGDVRAGSMIECPFPDNYFDFVVSIGCFHHTGNLKACIDQTLRVLKKGGRAIIMVYNRYSLRQWQKWPLLTVKSFVSEHLGKSVSGSTEEQRRAYDASSDNQAAPETEFYSVKELKKLLHQYQSLTICRENFDDVITVFNLPIYKFKQRSAVLDTKLVRAFGLDLYVEAQK